MGCQNKHFKHGRAWWLPVFALILVCVVVFVWNRFHLEIRLKGEQEMVLEYGEVYEEPGLVALVKGSVLFLQGWEPDISYTVEGVVDPEKLGLQTISYHVEYFGLKATATRTIQVLDTRSPVITLHTKPGYTVPEKGPYEEEGFSAWDNRDGDITHKVVRQEHLGYVTYAVMDSSGNPAYARREIPEYDYTPPELILKGYPDLTISAGCKYEDPGCTAFDNVDGDITNLIQVDGEVIWYKKGEYKILYTVTDSFGNTATAERIVRVAARPGTDTVYPGNKVIYLTFDDGPGPYTVELLDLLDSYDVKATFFVMNNGYYDVMRRIVEEGHSIAIHTMSHNYRKIYASEEAFFDDLYGMQKLIEDKTGVKTWLMRFPGGSSNAVSRFNEGIMTRLTEAVEDAGFRYFDWNVDSDDAGNARKSETVYRNVISGVANNQVSVVLQHDIHRYSVDAVEDILVWGFENGYTFLPLQENSPTIHHGLNN